jgi:hypothetical protein
LITNVTGKEGSKEREEFREDAFPIILEKLLKPQKGITRTQESLAGVKPERKKTIYFELKNGEDIQLSNFALIAHALG